MATQQRLFDLAIVHLRNGNTRAITGFARTFGEANATKRLDAIGIRGAFFDHCTLYNGYDYRAQVWIGDDPGNEMQSNFNPIHHTLA